MTQIADLLKRGEPVTWLFSGDSITQGAVHTRGWRDYTQLFRERLQEMGRNEDVVINSACGGWWLASLVERMEERVFRFHPDALFIMFGTNDAAGGPERVAEFEENYDKVVGTARDAGIGAIVLQTMLPMMPLDPERFIDLNEWPDQSLRESKLHGLRMRAAHLPIYAQATRDAADRLDVPLVNHWPVWSKTGTGRGQLLDGGFHPNEYGHRLIAHTIFRRFEMWDHASWTCRLFVPVNIEE